MPPLTTSPILSRSLLRTPLRIQRAQFARNASTRAAPAPYNFHSPTRRVANTMLMYFPVVAVVMFWPYGVAPVMDWVAEHSQA